MTVEDATHYGASEMYISRVMRRWRTVGPMFAVVAMSGCAPADRIEDDRLVQAGFTKVEPTMASWSGLPHPLPPHRFVHSSASGSAQVYWADPVACRCVYVGNEDTLKRFAEVEEVDTTKFDQEVSTTDYLQN
jgi:hypothetical protein